MEEIAHRHQGCTVLILTDESCRVCCMKFGNLVSIVTVSMPSARAVATIAASADPWLPATGIKGDATLYSGSDSYADKHG